MARLSDPAQPMAEKPSFSLPDVDMARGSYRVQLAAYRTLQRAGRGQNVLVALLRQDSEKFHIFGHKSRTDGESGFSFRIRTAPFETREEGLRICDEIRTYGHDGCLVIKHNDEVWEPLRIEQSAAQPVRVQLASFRTEKGAQKGQKILKDMLGDKAGELEILARDPASGDPKSFDYKIRTAPLVSPKAARELCEAYKAAGHADCIVIRQNDSLWKRVVAGTAADQAAMPNRFRIQLASYRSKENADAGRKRLAKLVGDNISPLYILTTEEFVTASDQKYYRILVSQVQSRIKAIELCKEVRAAGHDQCLIVSKGQN